MAARSHGGNALCRAAFTVVQIYRFPPPAQGRAERLLFGAERLFFHSPSSLIILQNFSLIKDPACQNTSHAAKPERRRIYQ